MTLQETAAVMDILTLAYPNFSRQLTDGERVRMAKLWTGMFETDDVGLVLASVKALIAIKTDDWPPSIGAVKEQIRKISTPDELDEAEAWGMVSMAVRRADWNHPEVQFDRLPRDVQRAVGTAHTLLEWGKAPEKELATVICSNFRRSYRARKSSEREYAVLPPSVRTVLEGACARLSLGDAK